MAKKESNQHLQIISDIQQKNFKPVYFLMGPEPYYIDLITNIIIENALDEADRDFNQTIVYGSDVNMVSVINAAKRYPMMAARQLVVVKEPQKSTILVLNYKYGTLKNKKLLAEIEKIGVLYESKKLYDYQLPGFINNYFVQKGYSIGQKECTMLSDAIGTDLSRLTGEMEKLLISLPREEKRITANHIESNIGISKDFNNFVLLNAVINRNYYKASQIIQYFEKNPKANPFIVTISVLFNFFSNLMLLYFIPNKSESSVSTELKLKNIYQAKDYMIALRNYNAYKCIDIISLIRIYDTRSKGVGTAPGTADSDLLKELVFKIMHKKKNKIFNVIHHLLA